MIYWAGMKIDSHLHLPVADNLQTLQSQKEQLLLELKNCGIGAGIVIPDNIRDSDIGDLERFRFLGLGLAASGVRARRYGCG